MKLFWRDQVMLIIFTVLQLALVVLVFWLDGYEDFKLAAYALLLGFCVFLLYLAYRYFTHRKFYALLHDGQVQLDESIQHMENPPLPHALGELLKAQYRHYQNRIIEGDRKQENHINFMNHWVHQMKTPLSVLELTLQDSEELRDESMLEETERIRKGLDMVLYMARLETFEQDFHVETIELRELVNKVILDNKRLFIRSFVYPDMQIEHDLKVETDGKWLRFIVLQLISNAVKYAAGTRSKVVVGAYVKERAIILEVRDSGVGIPASDLSRVFNPFFTGENGRQFKESTGMGLFIVKSVLDKMNHEIVIESKVGQGTTVSVIFPYAARQP
ncbi:sensor histidine kinase [Paenibacillaceae bacterium]|nr:sensor histidine kinase [Paenibacillaceae bacterium]